MSLLVLNGALGTLCLQSQTPSLSILSATAAFKHIPLLQILFTK